MEPEEAQPHSNSHTSDAVISQQQPPPPGAEVEQQLRESSIPAEFSNASGADVESDSTQKKKVCQESTQPEEAGESGQADEFTQKHASTTSSPTPQAGHGSDEDSCMLDIDYEEEVAPVLERVVSDEQAAADLEAIRGMWELAAVYEFMVQFKYWLNFSQLYPLQDLEEAIVKSPGPGLLAQLHIDLLQGIATRSHVGPENWVSTLAARLISEANAMQQPLSSLPFKPVRGKEAAGYAALSAHQRVLTLKALADMRADREDMRLLVDDFMRAQPGSNEPGGRRDASGTSTPPRRSGRGSSVPAPPPALSADDMRGRGPLGTDAAGFKYYWFDTPYDHDAPVGLMGSRLYVEGPPGDTVTHASAEQQWQQQAQHKQGEMQQQTVQEGDDRGAAGAVEQTANGDTRSNPAAAGSAAQQAVKQEPIAEQMQKQQQEEQNKDEVMSEAGQQHEQGLHAVKQELQQQQPDADMLDVEHPGTAAGKGKHNKQPDHSSKQEDTGVTGTTAAAGGEKAPGHAADASSTDISKLTAADPRPTDRQPVESTTMPDTHTASKAAVTSAAAAAGRGRKRLANGQPAADTGKSGADAGNSNAAEGDAPSSANKKSRTSKAAAGKAATASGLPPARPGRKAAAEAAAKVAQQLGGKTAAGGAAQAAAADASPAAAKKPPRGGKARNSSRVGSAAGSEDEDDLSKASPAASQAAQLSATGLDALTAAALGRGRPTRRAAADASAKIAAQAQNPPISKLAEEAAAVTSATKAASRSAKSRKGSTEGGEVKPFKSLGDKYEVPPEPDTVAGSWRLAADSVEGLEALAQELSQRDNEADVALGRLLLEQVVATLLERKEREEKYARARSRVAKSLGLDGPAAETGRAKRERRKPVVYSFDDYERSMRSAIRASQRGEFEELPVSGREPYKAPAYDIEVRRGRSGGAAEPVLTLEEIEALRKKRLEMAKLGLLDTNTENNQEQGQDKQEHQQQQYQPSEQPSAQSPATQADGAQGLQQQAAAQEGLQNQKTAEQAEAAAEVAAGPLPASAGGAAQAKPRKQPGSGVKRTSLAAAASGAPGGVAPKPRKPAAPKLRPAAPPPPPSAWQIAAAAAATAAAAAGLTSGQPGGSDAAAATSGGRPRRRAAAGVAAAVAAAAAAAGGREDDFLGMASHMQSEWESHHGADHTGQAAAATAVPASAAGAHTTSDHGWFDTSNEGMQRGHFHSSSTQSMNLVAEQRNEYQQSEQGAQWQQQWHQPQQQYVQQPAVQWPAGSGAHADTSAPSVGDAQYAGFDHHGQVHQQQHAALLEQRDAGAPVVPVGVVAAPEPDSLSAALAQLQAVAAAGAAAPEQIGVSEPALAQISQVQFQAQQQQHLLPEQYRNEQQQQQQNGGLLPKQQAWDVHSFQQQQHAMDATATAHTNTGCTTQSGCMQQPPLQLSPANPSAAPPS